jgi:hypothetical protein
MTNGLDFYLPHFDAIEVTLTTATPTLLLLRRHHPEDPFEMPYRNFINYIKKGSVAEDAGLRAGDIILSINGVSTVAAHGKHGLTHADVLKRITQSENGVHITFERSTKAEWPTPLVGPVWVAVTSSHLQLLASHSDLREVLHEWTLHQLTRFAHKDGVLGVEVDGEGAYFFSMMDASAPVKAMHERMTLLGRSHALRPT